VGQRSTLSASSAASCVRSVLVRAAGASRVSRHLRITAGSARAARCRRRRRRRWRRVGVPGAGARGAVAPLRVVAAPRLEQLQEHLAVQRERGAGAGPGTPRLVQDVARLLPAPLRHGLLKPRDVCGGAVAQRNPRLALEAPRRFKQPHALQGLQYDPNHLPLALHEQTLALGRCVMRVRSGAPAQTQRLPRSCRQRRSAQPTQRGGNDPSGAAGRVPQ